MVIETPSYVDELPSRRKPLEPELQTGEDLVSSRCISCHTLERLHRYKRSDWDRVVGRMRAYGLRLSEKQTRKIVTYLSGRKVQGNSLKKQESPSVP
jgi:mono/diheme cytochrome c family protein